jgi:hypothetical protein
MKKLLLLTPLLVLVHCSLAQNKLLKRSWIKYSIEDFTGKPQEPDTAYLRYDFDNTALSIGFEPGWNSLQMSWAATGKVLTYGFGDWKIETLSDTTLTLFQSGFRRMKFYAEEYLNERDGKLEEIGEFNGKPLYRTNRLVTPRYNSAKSLAEDVRKQDLGEDYNIRKAITFLMSFVVTDKGDIKDPKILKPTAEGYDKGIVNELMKSSRKWTAAKYKGQPVQTLMYLEIRFLDSLTQN